MSVTFDVLRFGAGFRHRKSYAILILGHYHPHGPEYPEKFSQMDSESAARRPMAGG